MAKSLACDIEATCKASLTFLLDAALPHSAVVNGLQVRTLAVLCKKKFVIVIYSTLLHASLHLASLVYPILLYPMLLYPILLYPILLYSTLSYSILFYFVLSYSILTYSILSYSILLYPILLYPTQSYPILPYSALSYSIPLYTSRNADKLCVSSATAFTANELPASMRAIIVWATRLRVHYVGTVQFHF